MSDNTRWKWMDEKYEDYTYRVIDKRPVCYACGKLLKHKITPSFLDHHTGKIYMLCEKCEKFYFAIYFMYEGRSRLHNLFKKMDEIISNFDRPRMILLGDMDWL